METFDDWLDRVPMLALRGLAGDHHTLRQIGVDRLRELVRTEPGMREAAERSWRIETEARERVAAMDPWEVRDAKMRHGLVD